MKKLFSSVVAIILLSIATETIYAVPLVGSYTINASQPTGGTNFISFTSFADSINLNGVSGNVDVTVAPGSGPYNERVLFSDIPGASNTAVVTLNGSGEILNSITDSTNRAALRLSNISYFTINNLRINRDSASTHAFYGIHIYNTGDHITIDNCMVDMTGTTSTLNGGFVASGSTTSILVAGDFHDISIQHNTSTAGGYGASVFGLSATVHATNIVISHNTFYDFNSNGIYLRETDGAIVSSNTFDKRTPNFTSVNAIQVAQAANINTQIFNNFIQVTQSSNGTFTFRGIYLFNGTGHKVYNNVIYNIGLVAGNFTGITIRTAATAPEIYFNTISIDNPNASTGDLIGIEEELSNTNSVLRNNLISISQPTTGMKAGLSIGAIATVTTALNSNYNLIWTPGGNTAIKGSLTPVLYPTLSDWQTASGQDSLSFAIDPGFVAPTSPIPTNLAFNDGGVTIPSISIDVLGNIRSTPPDIGAYEFLVDGINRIDAVKLLSYPNPAHSMITISLPTTLRSQAIVSVYDLTGALIKREDLKIAAGQKELSIDIEKLSPGIYLLMISGERGM